MYPFYIRRDFSHLWFRNRRHYSSLIEIYLSLECPSPLTENLTIEGKVCSYLGSLQYVLRKMISFSTTQTFILFSFLEDLSLGGFPICPVLSGRHLGFPMQFSGSTGVWLILPFHAGSSFNVNLWLILYVSWYVSCKTFSSLLL